MSKEIKNTPNVRVRASKLNGALSKGPVTEEGKKRSSRNALKHGLFSSVETILSSENANLFKEHHRGLYEKFAPRDAMELLLVERIIACGWRLRRVLCIETTFLYQQLFDREHIGHIFGNNEDRLYKLQRMEKGFERSMYAAINELERMRANSPAVPDQEAEEEQSEYAPELVHPVIEEMIQELTADPNYQVYDTMAECVARRAPTLYREVKRTKPDETRDWPDDPEFFTQELQEA